MEVAADARSGRRSTAQLGRANPVRKTSRQGAGSSMETHGGRLVGPARATGRRVVLKGLRACRPFRPHGPGRLKGGAAEAEPAGEPNQPEKGKPVARRGRKARGLNRDSSATTESLEASNGPVMFASEIGR